MALRKLFRAVLGRLFEMVADPVAFSAVPLRIDSDRAAIPARWRPRGSLPGFE
jgi:hypothetical protein